MPGSENLPNGSLLSLLLCPNSEDGCESGARMDSNMDKLMDTNENCFKDGSEVVPAADESTNDRAMGFLKSVVARAAVGRRLWSRIAMIILIGLIFFHFTGCYKNW